jgi:hypothetical protein
MNGNRKERMSRNISTSDETRGFKSLVPALDQGVRVLLYLQNNSREEMSLTKICQAVGIRNS